MAPRPQSIEQEGAPLVPRRIIRYRCPRNHEFPLPFAFGADLPKVWRCPKHGVDGYCLEASQTQGELTKASQGRPPKNSDTLGDAAGASNDPRATRSS
ncbi:RNA polymerase-binding protein RbpA [Kibdelosporangium lantanae]|uniref:RNA polymerase-binding protein RbpA n=1 Tax=Kibdelosporangium lantanae TaxID=1497396 RepID=A0ABW3M208_9PSEU